MTVYSSNMWLPVIFAAITNFDKTSSCFSFMEDNLQECGNMGSRWRKFLRTIFVQRSVYTRHLKRNWSSSPTRSKLQFVHSLFCLGRFLFCLGRFCGWSASTGSMWLYAKFQFRSRWCLWFELTSCTGQYHYHSAVVGLVLWDEIPVVLELKYILKLAVQSLNQWGHSEDVKDNSAEILF